MGRRLISNKGKRLKPSPPYGRMALRAVVIVLALVLLLLNILSYVFMVVRYYGDGMEPTLTDRQTVVVLKTDRVGQGDIVAFYYNNKILVRRVICQGGNTVDIDPAGAVSINDTVLTEPYVAQPSRGQCNVQLPVHVPVGSFFLMGDNRPVAMDSRLSEMGCIPRDRIVGKVIFRF